MLAIALVAGAGRLLLSEETPALDVLTPPSLGGSPVLPTLEVDNVDAAAKTVAGTARSMGLQVVE